MNPRLWWRPLAVLAVVVCAPTPARANNQWSCWHWASPDLTFRNEASGRYQTAFANEVSEWDSLSVLSIGSGTGIVGYSGAYGRNGWLGLARLTDYDRGTCEIFAAEAHLNTSYLDGYSFTAVSHVACQEVGHDFGLDHQKGRAQSCMNDMTLGHPYPNQHDVDLLDEIYGAAGGGGRPPHGPKAQTTFAVHWAGRAGAGDVHVVAEPIATLESELRVDDSDTTFVDLERVLFEVVASDGGEALVPGETFTLVRTAGVGGDAFAADGGPYESGRRYSLWLDLDAEAGDYVLSHPANRRLLLP